MRCVDVEKTDQRLVTFRKFPQIFLVLRLLYNGIDCVAPYQYRYWRGNAKILKYRGAPSLKPTSETVRHVTDFWLWFRCQLLFMSCFPICHCVWYAKSCRQSTNIRRGLVGNEIADHSDVVGASPAGATSSHSRFNNWLQRNGQRQLQDETRNTSVWGIVMP